MKVYNLFPPLAGRFTQWAPHLEQAADMGFDWVFLNPVQRPGKSGSLYSIADYFALNPLFVDPASPLEPDAQLRDTMAFAESRGLRVMVDLVINHCAADSRLFHNSLASRGSRKALTMFVISNSYGSARVFSSSPRASSVRPRRARAAAQWKAI